MGYRPGPARGRQVDIILDCITLYTVFPLNATTVCGNPADSSNYCNSLQCYTITVVSHCQGTTKKGGRQTPAAVVYCQKRRGGGMLVDLQMIEEPEGKSKFQQVHDRCPGIVPPRRGISARFSGIYGPQNAPILSFLPSIFAGCLFCPLSRKTETQISCLKL